MQATVCYIATVFVECALNVVPILFFLSNPVLIVGLKVTMDMDPSLILWGVDKNNREEQIIKKARVALF